MTWQNERKFREEIVEIHRHLYQLGFSVANDGNTSVRLDRRRILITPSGLNKAKLEPSQIATVDIDGKPLSGNYPPSSEILVHVGVYQARPDVTAIIHAHPPFCIACSLAGVSLDDYYLPEVVLTLGKIPTARYATTGTQAAADAVLEYIVNHDSVILDRHGSVTVGKSLEEAMLKLERIEHTAKIVVLAKALGSVTRLPQPEIERLLQLRPGGPIAKQESPNAVDKPIEVDPKLVELIARQVSEELMGMR